MNLPSILFKQYDNAIDPSGSRNLDVAASGFVKILDTSVSGVLDFGFLDITSSGALSQTKMVFFRPLTLGDANRIFNFRFYLSSISAWGVGTYNFLWDRRIPFTSGVQLSQASENVPTSLPTSGNVLSSASGTFIGSITESGVSQYIYLGVYVNNDVLVGTKGGAGNGGFRFRLTYDFV